MKLRNKHTGEIIEWENDLTYKLDKTYTSLKDFLENYEDAPEEKKSWEEEVQIRVLPSGLKIADRNYYEGDKTEFTWDKAMERFENDPNWRLPTPRELCQMALDLGFNEGGVFEGELLAKELDSGHGASGFFWSATAYSYPFARSLYFYSTSVNPQNYSNKALGLTVRCVARAESWVARGSSPGRPECPEFPGKRE